MRDQLALVHPLPQRTSSQQESPHQRLLLYPHELYRVPASYRRVRVIAGTALLTQAARDLILGAGYTATLESGQDAALVSALGNGNLILELY